MSIDTGQSLSFNQNYPLPNVNQPSQQFRDNFAIIKTAIELIQSASSNSSSILQITTSQSVAGIITIDASYIGNSLTLPIGSPTINPVGGMIRFITPAVQFYDGTGWRTLINQDSSGNVTLPTLTITNKITLNNDPVSGTDAVRLSYLNTALSNLSSTILNTVNNSGFATTTQVNTETNNRVAADVNLQNQINALSLSLSNSNSNSATLSSAYLDLANSITQEANTRAAADTLLQNQINTLGSDLSSFQSNVSLQNAIFTTQINNLGTLNNAAVAFTQTVYNASNTVASSVTAETARAETQEAILQNQIDLINSSSGSYLLTSGGTLTGDLNVDSANVYVNNGTIGLTDGSINVENSIITLANSSLYLPKSNLTLDSGQYLLFNAIPNLVGGDDGGFIAYDQNNFAYARMSDDVANAVAADIAANGIANANTHWEFSCLRIGTTNDYDNGLNNDSVALEAAADVWLNPGWAGGGINNLGQGTPDIAIDPTSGLPTPRTAQTANASIYVGNATSYTVRIVRATGDIITNGNITAAGNISGLSDISLKDNVKNIENALDKIDQIRGVTYNRNDLDGYPEQMGVIAQELENVAPQVISQHNGLMSVSYGNLTALLIEGIKELRQEIEEIKKKL